MSMMTMALVCAISFAFAFVSDVSGLALALKWAFRYIGALACSKLATRSLGFTIIRYL